MLPFELPLRVSLCAILFHSVVAVQPIYLHCDTWNSPIPSLSSAMNGFDPMLSDPFTFPNPGFKQNIFTALKREPDGRNSLNDFLGRSGKTVYCSSNVESKSIKNFNGYKKQIQTDITFAKGSESSQSFDQTFDASISIKGIFSFGTKKRIHFENLSGSGLGISADGKEMLDFFTEHGGELIEASATCVTYSIAISSFSKPIFTDSFSQAMKKLQIAAMNPNSESSDETFVKFTRDFGTHYMKTTKLGAKIFFHKKFKEASRTAEQESNRKNCIEKSFWKSLSVPVIVDIKESFNRNFASCTDGGQALQSGETEALNTETIISIGSLPTMDTEVWATKAIEIPVPISFQLEKISRLMKPEWINDIRVSDDDLTMGYLNGSQISNFLESKNVECCHMMLGGDCPQPKTGCGYSSECSGQRFCVNDKSSLLGYRCIEGKTVLIGGNGDPKYDSADVQLTSNGKFTSLPDLPRKTADATAIVHRNKLYRCAGTYNSDSCDILHLLEATPSWDDTLALPVSCHGCTMMAVGDDLWILRSNKVIIVPFNGRRTTEHDLPWGLTPCACGGGDRARRFIIPSNTTEIWVNTDSAKPSEWTKMVTSLSRRAYARACVLLGTDLYVTGGRGYRNLLGSDNHEAFVNAEKIDVTDWRKTDLPHMIHGRDDHAMGLLGNKVAVFGGHTESYRYSDTIEVFNVALNKWTLSPIKMPGYVMDDMGYATF